MTVSRPDATLLIDFLNTVDIENGTDVLEHPDEYDLWAAGRGWQPGDLDQAKVVRSRIREGLMGGTGTLDEFAIPVRFEAGGRPRFVPKDLTGAVVALAAELTALGLWDRVKLCPADDCLEAFFDDSRNRSRVWCDMADCGNLAKVRGFRSRAAGSPEPA